MEQAITHTNQFYFSTHHTPWYINQLLREQIVNQEVLNYNAVKIGFIPNKQYFLWTLQKSNADENLSKISYLIFNNLSALHVAFIQSQIALSQRPSNDGTYFIENYQDYILQAIEDLEESDGLIYPAMNRFLKDNENYRKELLIYLEKYIISGLNISATVNATFIHRHTVIYRIENIL